MESQECLCVVGGGLIGCLLALLLSKKGYFIHLLEKKEFLSLVNNKYDSCDRSINLIINQRGSVALKKVGIDISQIKNVSAINGICVHLNSGNTYEQNYQQGMYSVKRQILYECLLQKILENKQITPYFGCCLSSVDPENTQIKFYAYNQAFQQIYSAIFACDGANSFVRNTCLPWSKEDNFRKSQTRYCQIPLSSYQNESLTRNPQFLHSWPRNDLVLTSFPNPKGEDSLILFLQPYHLQNMSASGEFVKFWNQLFPDFDETKINNINSILQKVLQDTNKLGYLCQSFPKSWYYKETCLFGDAAHAMLPFLGQGFNTSAEDCGVLADILDEHFNWAQTFEIFQQKRFSFVQKMQVLAQQGEEDVMKQNSIENLAIIAYLEQNFCTDFISFHTAIQFTTLNEEIIMNMIDTEKTIISLIKNAYLGEDLSKYNQQIKQIIQNSSGNLYRNIDYQASEYQPFIEDKISPSFNQFHQQSLYSSVQHAIEQIYLLKQRPAYQIEIFQVIRKQLKLHSNIDVFQAIWEMFVQNMLYSNSEQTLYSNSKFDTNFETFIEKTNRLFFCYEIEAFRRIKSKTQGVNLKQLKAILVQNNSSTSFDIQGPLNFLDGCNIDGDKIALATYPRTGNTLIRNYLELITGVVTGCDMNIIMNIDFQMNGMMGEEIVDDTVWIFKTHYPFPKYNTLQSYANKVLCSVRNPLDSLASFFTLLITKTQTQTIPQAQYDSVTFKNFVIKATKLLKQYYWKLICDCQLREVPLFFVRYEDLVVSPTATLNKILCFLLNKETLGGTVVEKRIENLFLNQDQANFCFIPKNITLNKHRDKFSDELFNFIQNELQDIIYYFGYCNSITHESQYPYFQVKTKGLHESITFEGFKILNSQSMSRVQENEEALKLHFIDINSDKCLPKDILIEYDDYLNFNIEP